MCESVFVVNIMHRNILLEMEAKIFLNPRRVKNYVIKPSKALVTRHHYQSTLYIFACYQLDHPTKCSLYTFYVCKLMR